MLTSQVEEIFSLNRFRMDRINSLLDDSRDDLKLILITKLSTTLHKPQGRFTVRPSHHNLYLYSNFLEDYCIPETSIGEKIHIDKNYLELRSIQNKDWAYHLISEGLEYSRAKDYKRAIIKYEGALSMDDDNIEALMARGIALANSKKYKGAIKDISRVLEIDPNHRNANTNLNKTKSAHDMIIAERESAQSGEFLLSSNYDPKNPQTFEKSLELSNDLFP